MIRRSVLFLIGKLFNIRGHIFLGFDTSRYEILEGGSREIFLENDKRIAVMLQAEMDSIEYCLRNGIKVIIILEPYIKPLNFSPPYGTGFRDKEIAFILSECHRVQQSSYFTALVEKYRDNENIVILDMRTRFKDRYRELFYDEAHLNGKGNAIKAQYVYTALDQLFFNLSLSE